MNRHDRRASKNIAPTPAPPTAVALARQALGQSASGDHAAALRSAVHALTLEENAFTRTSFVAVVRMMQFYEDNAMLRGLLLRALSQQWGRPEDLAAQAADLIRAAGTQLEALARDELLHTLICLMPNQDMALEAALMAGRREMLAHALAGEDVHAAFHAALARQCFLNEYVLTASDDEMRDVEALRMRVTAALDAGEAVTPARIAALACYAPLTDARLLERAWPAATEAILTQQLREPAEEKRLAAALPQLTPVSDGVSQAVRQQYEENPYPRWVVVGPAWRVHGAERAPADILIAGCGTGRNAIETAQVFPEARVLAVDLSRASLGHAARKSAEMKVGNVEYAQADLLEMGRLDRRFDLIEAMGVLHHMADPFAGWRTLLSLLKPHGVMRIGLYSPVARRDLSAARAQLQAQGFASTPGGVRAGRRHLMQVPGFGEVVQRPDFFSVSSCRDLLFHVQETLVPLSAIAAFTRDNALKVLGVDLDAPVLMAYRKRFPRDADATDLDNWAAFERDNPSTFDGMVQFWVQKTQ
jgi:2-polyprenyl-3-methyl-5-hydroxy-6-metoxy-1,4-benzoquinol methylase